MRSSGARAIFEPSPRPRNMVIASAVWVLCSIVFLDTASAKVLDLHAAGQYISPWRYGQAFFWIAMLVFWIGNGWMSWKRSRAQSATG